MVEQRAVAIGGVGELVDEVAEQLHVEGVERGEPGQLFRAVAVVRGRMVRLGAAHLRIGASAQLARLEEGGDPREVALVGEHEQVEHQFRVFLVRGRHTGRAFHLRQFARHLLFGQRDEIGGELFGHGDLKQRGVEAEVLFQREREGIGDGGDHLRRIGHEFLGHGLPFLHGARPVPGVVRDEVFLGQPELGFEGAEFVGDLGQPRIGQEVAESVEERERVAVDERMGAALDEREVGGGGFGQKPFVAEADQPVGDSVGREPEIFGPEFLAAAPVAHADVDEHALAGEDVEQVVHGMVPFFC